MASRSSPSTEVPGRRSLEKLAGGRYTDDSVRVRIRFSALFFLGLASCALDSSGVGPAVNSELDAGSEDGGRDANLPDAPSDARMMDAGPATRDAGPVARDAGPRDAGSDVDECSTGADEDGDSVSDACDRCPGFDDREDDDGDGIPDGCDDWPCGVRPVIDTPVSGEFITISGVQIAGGENTRVLNVGDTFDIRVDWAIDDTDCPGCINQIELGFTRISRFVNCLYDANPPNGGESGTDEITAFVPTGSTGVYELRFNRGLNFSCPLSRQWWNSAPGPERTIGAVCIRP